jgi:hypothetical protein
MSVEVHRAEGERGTEGERAPERGEVVQSPARSVPLGPRELRTTLTLTLFSRVRGRPWFGAPGGCGGSPRGGELM